jgi:hypothetical protein
LRKATISFVMSVSPSAWNNSAPTGWFFLKFDIWVFFENLFTKINFHLNISGINGTSHKDLCTFISHWISLRMRNVSRIICRENLHRHVHEGLGMFPVPCSSKWSWSLHLFLRRLTFLRPFGLYCSACFGSLFVSILCTCCSHFSWYCFKRENQNTNLILNRRP